MALIDLNLDDRSYPIQIVKHDRGELVRLIRHVPHNRLFVIADATVWALHGKTLGKSMKLTKASTPFVLPLSEKTKTSATAQQIQDYLLGQKISRDDLIVAVGGGVTSDLVGFAAATVLRGVRWGVVSTSLMGMVDAAIGGKTGVNHAGGKNLIGAIWQPSFVYANISHLATLKAPELVSGFGEILKYAGLTGGPLLEETDRFLTEGDFADSTALYRLVSAGAALKAQIVAEDERESGARIFLNLGHTFGHAVEHAAGFGRILHGEGVIVGLVGALALSSRMNSSQSKELVYYRHMVEQALRLVPHVSVKEAQVVAAMQSDKKRKNSALQFVLLKKPGKAYICRTATPSDIRQSVSEMLRQYQALGGTDAPHSRR
jgi:3-dehydroquinate synthase